MTSRVDKLKKSLANLRRNKQRAKRRGDPNFRRISAEHRAKAAQLAEAQAGEPT